MKYICSIRVLVTVGLCVSVICATVATMHKNTIKKELIIKGASPTQLVCAFNPPAKELAKVTLCGVQNGQHNEL